MKGCGYIKQRSSNTCGPVAVYNALIWAQKHSGHRSQSVRLNLRKMIKHCDPHWRLGTPHERITSLLGLYKHLVTLRDIIELATLDDVTEALYGGCGVILEFSAREGEDHYVFLFAGGVDIYIANNRISEPTVQTITPSMLQNEFLIPFSYDEPQRFENTIPHFQESNRIFPRIWSIDAVN